MSQLYIIMIPMAGGKRYIILIEVRRRGVGICPCGLSWPESTESYATVVTWARRSHTILKTDEAESI